MTDSTAALELVTHMLCCSCGMYLLAAASSENDQGSMNLASNTAPLPSIVPVEGCRHPAQHRMFHMPLHVGDAPAGIALVPEPVQVFGDQPELNDEVARE